MFEIKGMNVGGRLATFVTIDRLLGKEYFAVRLVGPMTRFVYCSCDISLSRIFFQVRPSTYLVTETIERCDES